MHTYARMGTHFWIVWYNAEILCKIQVSASGTFLHMFFAHTLGVDLTGVRNNPVQESARDRQLNLARF